MKITVVNGQSHKGSTYHIGKMLADKLGGKVTEFFLPKDFSDMCIGCTSCFIKNEHLCPHHARLEKLTNAIDDADVLIFTSPVYVYHTTGAMKSFLDHYGTVGWYTVLKRRCFQSRQFVFLPQPERVQSQPIKILPTAFSFGEYQKFINTV